MEFNTIEELVEDIRQGKMVLLVDDEDRENEGDLVLAADHVTPNAINFMAVEARGLICLSLSSQQIDRLNLPLMVRDEMNYTPNKTAFTVSIEAAYGVTTGISAHDRAHTIRVASNPNAKASDVHMPGHIFPIRAQQGGVLKRAGHTEGSVDLAKLAGLNPAAVICEIMNDDGTMARVPDLKKFAIKHNIKIGTIVDLIEYRIAHDTLVEPIYSAETQIASGSNYQIKIFKSRIDQTEHFVLQKGEIHPDQPTLVRVHVDSYSKELFGILKQGESPLNQALKILEQHESGLFILLRGNNPTVGLLHEAKVFVEGQDSSIPHKMDSRDYGIGAQILRSLGVKKIKLMTNTPEKRVGLKAFGLEIVDSIPLHK